MMEEEKGPSHLLPSHVLSSSWLVLQVKWSSYRPPIRRCQRTMKQGSRDSIPKKKPRREGEIIVRLSVTTEVSLVISLCSCARNMNNPLPPAFR